MGLFGTAHGWGRGEGGGGGVKMPHISHNDETWRSQTLPKEDPKNI